MDKIFLRIIAWFNPVLEGAGVDTYQLNEILRIKLLIDTRRPKGAMGARKNANTTKSATATTSWLTFILSLVMGLFMGSVLFIFKKPLVGQTVYFSIFMVVMSLTLITDFTTVLIDVRDQFIIIPRPVNDRTVTMARILHVTIYVLKLALMQAFPALIMMIFIDGFFGMLLFLVQVIITTLLTIFLVNIIYLLLMKAVSPQRFKDIVSYFQIVFSVSIFAAYYLLPRLVKLSVLGNFDLLSHSWAYFIPPVWIAAINEVLLHPARATFTTSIMAVIGVTVPLASIWLVTRVLAPGFNRRLSIIALSDGTASTSKAKKIQNRGLIDRVANILAPDPVENAGFRITWKLAARTREFKMKVYPVFAYVPIYFIYFMLNGKGESLAERYHTIQSGKSYIFLIYMSTFVLSGILQFIAQSEKYKSSWVYYALPINQPGKILGGMYKAIIALYFFPYCLVLSIISIAVWGPAIVNDVVLAFFIGQIYGILMALFLVKGLPFSQPVLNKQSGGRMIKSFFILGLAAAMGGAHYFLSQWENVIWIAIIPTMLVNWVMFNYYRKQTWENIELSEV